MKQISLHLKNRADAIAANIASQFEKGIYVNNAENRKVGRVGMTYGEELTHKFKKLTSKINHLDTETGLYKNERFQLHKKLINKIVESGTVSEKPTVILFLGGGGSGKGHVYKTLIKPELEKTKEKFAYLNVDDIKEDLPEYKKYIEQDAKSAAYRVHEESADIGRMAYRKLMKEKRNFVYDATLANSYSAVNKINDLKKAGYNVRLIGVVADVETVKKAALQRGKVTGRYVPLDIIEDRQIGARNTFKYIVKEESHKLSHIELYNNDELLQGETPVKVYENGTILHKQKYEKL